MTFNQLLAEREALQKGEPVYAEVLIEKRRPCSVHVDSVVLVPGTYAEKNGKMYVFAKRIYR